MSKNVINVSSKNQINSLLKREDFSNVFSQLLTLYEQIENTPDYTIQDFVNNILIYLIHFNIKSAKLLEERNRLNVEFYKKNENQFKSLKKIITVMNCDPFNNIYSELNDLKNYSDNDVFNTFLNEYECEQAIFLSKIYSCISKNSLLNYLNPNYSKSNLDNYVKKFNLTEVKDKSDTFYTFENFNLNSLSKDTGKLKSNMIGSTLKNYEVNRKDLQILGLNATLLDKQVKSLNTRK